MSKHTEPCKKHPFRQSLPLRPLQTLQMLGNSTSLKLLSSATQPVVQKAGYILSSSKLRSNRYRYLARKNRATPLPRLRDWAFNYNAHHIIPNEVVRDIIDPADVAPYNEAWNCTMLPNLSRAKKISTFKYKGKSGIKHRTKPLHANHPHYNTAVRLRMAQSIKPGDDDATKLQKAKDLALIIRTTMRQQVSKQIKLNDLQF